MKISDRIFSLAFGKEEAISNDELNAVKLWLINNYDYQTPENIFEAEPGNNFKNRFTRKLKPEVLKDLKAKSQDSFLSSPCEADLSDYGQSDSEIMVKGKIITPSEHIKSLGLNTNCLVLNLKLRKPYYHWVHAPLAGRCEQLFSYEPNQTKCFGGNSITAIKIGVEIILLMIGERKVQCFNTLKAAINAEVENGDPLGYFSYGSQVLLLNYSSKKDLIPKLNSRLFVLDPLIN
jgi:hypothetical protein